MLFIEAPIGTLQVNQIAQRLRGVPLLYNIAASGKTPDRAADELGRLGFRIAIQPNWIILAAYCVIELQDIKQMLRCLALLAVALLTMVSVASTASAQTQNYPDKPVRLVVGYSAASGVDIVGRTLAEELSSLWGHISGYQCRI